MNTLSINDLNFSDVLDRTAMAELIGGDAFHLKALAYANGSWSGYTLMSKQYQGVVCHDGSQSYKYSEIWRRTRVQAEYSYWDHFVKA